MIQHLVVYSIYNVVCSFVLYINIAMQEAVWQLEGHLQDFSENENFWKRIKRILDHRGFKRSSEEKRNTVPDANCNLNNIVQVNPCPFINTIGHGCTEQCSFHFWFVTSLINGGYLYLEKTFIGKLHKTWLQYRLFTKMRETIFLSEQNS